MKKVILRKNGTKRVVTVNDQPSKTDQSFKKDCDVNAIMNRFLKTGQISHLAKSQGQYIDVSEVQDLHNSLIQVNRAQAAFDALPAAIRKKMGNTPLGMMEWLADPENNAEAIKLGFKNPPSPPSGSLVTEGPETNGDLAGGSPSKKTKSKKPLRNDDLNDDNPEA